MIDKYTPDEAAEFLNINRRTLQELLVPSYDENGKKYYTVESIKKFKMSALGAHLSVAEFQQAIGGVSRTTLKRLNDTGKIKRRHTITGRTYYNYDDVRKFWGE